jgi:hypothetical protein
MNRVHRQIINEAMAPSALDMNPPMEPFDAQAEEAKEAAQRPAVSSCKTKLWFYSFSS